MRELETVAREVIGWLHQQQHAYALIGGLAVSFRAIERLTKDVDLAVVVENDQQAENIVRELCSLGYDIQTLLEQTKHGRIATVRLIKRDQGSVFVDLLFSSSGVEPEIAEEAEPIQIFPELSVMTASLPALLALKVLAADSEKRPQDEIDIKHLLKEATENEIRRATELLSLIDQRGYQRGKNLKADFARFQVRFLNG